jgi:hypothetical protein
VTVTVLASSQKRIMRRARVLDAIEVRGTRPNVISGRTPPSRVASSAPGRPRASGLVAEIDDVIEGVLENSVD